MWLNKILLLLRRQPNLAQGMDVCRWPTAYDDIFYGWGLVAHLFSSLIFIFALVHTEITQLGLIR